MPAATQNVNLEDPPSEIDPYAVLGVEKSATPDEIKKAYRKQALRHHPDKADANVKDAAHVRFQEIAFAYAILSDVRRRSRYDTTGRTEESLDLEDDDFNWTEYYREQWADAVSGDALEEFKAYYQGSEEEKKDLLASYVDNEGDLNGVFEYVMLSNPIDDEKRFRVIIDAAIKSGEVEAFDSYVKESKKSRKQRLDNARTEAAEAMETAKELGVDEKLFGNKKSKTKKKGGEDNGEAALAAIIQQRQKGRSESFLDRLEEKYGGASKSSKRSKRTMEEPPEELFQKNAKRRN